MVVRRAELCLRACAERGVIEAVAIVPGAVVASFRIHAGACQRLAEPERAQDAGGVGAELDAGADLAERFGLLEELGVDAARPQRQQRREATDAAAGDKHLEIVDRIMFAPLNRESPTNTEFKVQGSDFWSFPEVPIVLSWHHRS